MLGYLLQTANPTSSFKDRLKALVNEYKSVAPLSAMGFAEGWENEKSGNSHISGFIRLSFKKKCLPLHHKINKAVIN